jgi:hypothetical protein
MDYAALPAPAAAEDTGGAGGAEGESGPEGESGSDSEGGSGGSESAASSESDEGDRGLPAKAGTVEDLDWMDLLRGNRIKKQTVPVLKGFCGSHGMFCLCLVPRYGTLLIIHYNRLAPNWFQSGAGAKGH